MKSLNSMQIKNLLVAAKSSPTIKIRIMLALGTGLRRGDIESLKISDVNFEGNTCETTAYPSFIDTDADGLSTVATQFSATANPAALSISISIEGNGINRSNVLDSASSRPMSSSYQGLKIRFNSNKVGGFFKVLLAKPWSLSLYGLRQVWHNISTITADRIAQECDPSTMMAPYGTGLVSSLVSTLYNHAGCYNAINSHRVRGCF